MRITASWAGASCAGAGNLASRVTARAVGLVVGLQLAVVPGAPPAISTTSSPMKERPQTAHAMASGLSRSKPACLRRKSQREATNNATPPSRAKSACFFR